MSIPAREALKLIALNASNPKFRIIDVRTSLQRASIHIPNSQHIPLDQLQHEIGNLDEENTYLIYCRSGVRSAKAVNFLKLQGFNAINMEGGIVDWQKLTQQKDGSAELSKKQKSSLPCNLI